MIAAIAAIAFLVLGGLGLFALLNNDDDPEVARGDGGRTSTDDGDTDDDDVTSDDDGGETDGGDTDTDDGGDDPLPPEPPQVALTIDNTIADLQEYWEDELPEVFGPEYIPLDEDSVFPLSSVNSLSCGGEDIPLDLLQGNAIYCPPDDYITWDDEFLFPDLEAQFGELAPALVMAHEWGHAIQARNGMDETRVPTVLIELQADCLAGGWVNDLLNRTEGLRIQPTDLDQAVAGLLNFSDPIEVSSQSPGAHGSGFDRVTAFGDGVEGGAAACADYLDGGVEPIDIDLGGLGDTGGNLPFLNLDDQGTNAPDLFLQDLQVFYDTEAAAVGETVPQFVDITRRRDTGDITCELPSGTLVAVCESPDGEQAGLLWDEQLIEFHNNIGDFGSALFISIEISRLVAPSLGLDATPAQLDCMSGAWTGFVGELPSERTTPEDRDDERLILSPGDLDEAIVGMLEAQAMDRTVFERVQSFRDGYFEGISACQGQ